MPPPEVLDLGALPEADPNFHQQRGEALYATLNQGQRAFVDDVLRCISDPDHRRNAEGNCYSLTGEGGAGKSRCYETIYHMVRAMNMHVVVMASTGVAATLLPDGKTVHKTFVVDVPTYSDSVCNVKEGTKQANELTRAAVFLWDEISMSQRYVLEAIDLKLQELCNAPGVPFGGAVFIVGGDWRQALPIQRGAIQSELVDLSVRSSELFRRHFKEFELTENMRSREDAGYTAFVRRIGNGEDFDGNEGDVNLPEEIVTRGDLVNETFGDLFRCDFTRHELVEYLCNRAILAPLNRTCEKYNRDIISMLPGRPKEYISVDVFKEDSKGSDATFYPPEFLNTLNPPELPPHSLVLKENSVVLLMRNLWVEKSMCNGTRLLVTKMGERHIEVMHMNGNRKGKTELLPRIKLLSNMSTLPFRFFRHQFPVKVAYAMTISKSQGQTLAHASVDLTHDVFGHGLLYVALSRVRSSHNIRVLLPESRGTTARNIVVKCMLARRQAPA